MKHKTFLRRAAIVALLVLAPVFVLSVKTIGREASETDSDQWEYLVIANASRTNFTPTDNPDMRKAPRGAFGNEGFVLETQLDKVGAKGWELVAVTGTADPVFYFKRRK